MAPGTVFGDDELPVLFAHGHHNRPESIVLATTAYRRAYRGMLGAVLGRRWISDRPCGSGSASPTGGSRPS